jgi:hypothetical protein
LGNLSIIEFAEGGAMIRKRVNLAVNTSNRFGAKTMSQQHEERHAAAQAFVESLTQLEQTLESAELVKKHSLPQSPAKLDPSEPSTQESAQFSLSRFEDAIADLEQFIQNNQSQENPPQID